MVVMFYGEVLGFKLIIVLIFGIFGFILIEVSKFLVILCFVYRLS